MACVAVCAVGTHNGYIHVQYYCCMGAESDRLLSLYNIN